MDSNISLIQSLLGKRRISADIDYSHNPTDITDIIFNDLIDCWEYPYWEINRHGMSCTILEDSTIYIGGEHEDYYDPNFHIYNEVIVITKSNNINIYSYPKNIFPPTDFHCAIPINNFIWILGSIGYPRYRKKNIQVCRLHIPSMEMELIINNNNSPPWINFDCDNNCELCEDGTSIKVNNTWMLDTINIKWSVI